MLPFSKKCSVPPELALLWCGKDLLHAPQCQKHDLKRLFLLLLLPLLTFRVDDREHHLDLVWFQVG